ncbi:MAG: nicotinate-nucleotide adenylyltransferase [Burkholderiales bacterium]
MKRIGLLGGSFDPVHQGHLALARAALDHLALDELRWVPAGQPWQKARSLTNAEHRAALLRLAIAGEPRFWLERIEICRDGPSYTIDTVRRLQAASLKPAQWFLIIGQDQYANFHTWHEWQALLGMVTLAVAARDGQAPQAPGLQGVPHAVETVPMRAMPMSATAIRARLAAGEEATVLAPALVTPAVASYIARHNLYRPDLLSPIPNPPGAE